MSDVRVDDKQVELSLWDTAGREGYAGPTPLTYSNAHVVLIAFSVENPTSLDNVKARVRESRVLRKL